MTRQADLPDPLLAPLAFEALRDVVLAWPGVKETSYRYGGDAFVVNGRTIAHWHPSGVMGARCLAEEREHLLNDTRVRPHHFYPASTWVSFTLDGPNNLSFAVGIVAKAYGYARREVPTFRWARLGAFAPSA